MRRWNRTLVWFFIRFIGVTGNTARNHIRDFTNNIVSTPNNKSFNEDVMDVVEDLADSLQDSQINSTSDLMTCLTEENDLVTEFGDTFDSYMRDAKNGKSVDKFIRSVKDSVRYFQELEANSGLAGNLRFADVSNDQLQELQNYMRNFNQVSKSLFKVYGNEIR